MTDYPQSLPCPTVSDYKGEIDFGFSSVTFNRGNKRRRRMASTRLEKYDLSFVYTTQQLWQFQSWANMFGFDWHYMPIVTHFSGFVDPASALPHRVRLSSDLSISALTDGMFRVRVSIDVDTATQPGGIVVKTGDWVIGGTPPSPSPDWIIAGSPPAPSDDWVTAGIPATPAA